MEKTEKGEEARKGQKISPDIVRSPEKEEAWNKRREMRRAGNERKDATEAGRARERRRV